MNVKTAIYTFLLFFTSLSSIAQIQSFTHIKNYTTDDGLPHNIGYSVIQDSKGYLWFGTDDGLARFNGKSFKIYRSSNGLLSNYVIDVAESKDGKLWIGSWKGGLNYIYNDSVFTPKLDHPLFRIAYVDVQEDKMWLSNRKELLYPYTYVDDKWKFSNASKKTILYLTKDGFPKYDIPIAENLIDTAYVKALKKIKAYLSTDKTMLMFHSLAGIWQYHNNGTFTPFYPEVIKNDTVYGVCQDAEQRYWIGGKGKIITIDASKKVQVIQKGLPNRGIYDIQSTSSGKIYFISDQVNLSNRTVYCYDPVTQATIDLKKKFGMKALPIRLIVDQEDNVWIITNGEGVYCIPTTHFTNFGKQQGLSTVFTNTINEDSQGNIYVGTINGVFMLENGIFSRQKILNLKASQEIVNIINDPEGHLLIQLFEITKQTFQTSLLKKTNQTFKSIPHYGNLNKPIYLDNQNRAWMYFDYKLSFHYYSQSGLHYGQHYIVDKNLFIQQIFEYQGKHWLATNKGLFSLKPSPKTNAKAPIKPIFLDSLTVDNGLSSNFINHTAIGQNGELWIGTKEGLCRWQKGKLTCFTTKDGLVSNNCRRVLVDHKGIVWLGTPKGLSSFDGRQFINYSHKNGLIAPDINCLFLDSKKRLWIGTSKGVSMLNLTKQLQTPAPKLYIEKVQLNGLLQSPKTTLRAQHHSQIKVYFAALTYTYPEGVRYQYRINGGKWQETELNFIEYNALSTGSYSLEIRAKKFDSLWSTPTQFTFKIIPPFWDTWWFRVLLVLGLIGLMYGVVKWRSKRLEKDKEKLEQIVTQRTSELAQQKEEIASQAEKLKEMDQIKSRFFSNISHEFRTPLALIKGPADKIIQTTQEANTRQHSQLILNNTQRLLKLINQLLDFSKLESGKMVLQPRAGNFNAFLKNIVHSFELLAAQKQVTLDLQLPTQEVAYVFDHDKLEKVFFNLLSNALKFTQKNGTVRLQVEKKEDGLHIKLTDTGIGIPQQSLPFVFDRFYQVDGSQTREFEGTGIGLSLVKELLELHEGSISVDSKPNQGTTFWIQLPAQQDIIEQVSPEVTEMNLDLSQATVPIPLATSQKQPQTNDDAAYTVLVVEDNEELRQFISTELASTYQVIEATNGAEGIEQALTKVPDLIVSDLMMPQVDGLALLKTLRDNPLTSHIPVIILSAKASFESKIAGLEIGGNDYLTKPFSPKELMLRIKNTLESREKLKQVLTQQMTTPGMPIEPSQVTVTSVDEAFLAKALETVEAHLGNVAFDVSVFSKEMGMSQSNLLRKLKALTGLSVIEFIRSIRLKRAASLIKQRSGGIEEIAFEVGFNDPSYFSRCFKKQFGVAPSKY